SHRRGRLDLPLDQPLALELAKPLREQPVRETGDGPGQLAEALRALGERAEDRPRPALADQLDRRVEVRANPGAVSGLLLGLRPGLHFVMELTERKGRAGQLAQGPVSTGDSASARARRTTSSGTANPPGVPDVVAAKTVPITLPRVSIIGPPE